MDWSTISNIANIVVSVSVLLMIIQLLREIKSQNTQSFFYLHNYLSNDTLNAARKAVRVELSGKLYNNWTDEDKNNANRVCASYDQAGILLSSGVIDRKTKKQFLTSSWGKSIIHQYESLKEFLDNRQAPKCKSCKCEAFGFCDEPKCTGRAFFEHFYWLYEETKKYQTEGKIN